VDGNMRIDLPLSINKNRDELKQKMVVSDDGKPSLTLVYPKKYSLKKDATLVEIETKTGRQHQIRVHMFHMKHRLLGDPLYGVSKEIAVKYLDEKLSKNEKIEYLGAERLMLHAYKISFDFRGKSYEFISPSSKSFFDFL
jgi:23S rRNA pseudouridine1911/1915/1917 synthase